MKRETYGCPCCSGLLDRVFQENKEVRDLKSKAESGGGWSCNWGIDWGIVGRRDFLKGGAATAGLAAMLPEPARAQDQSTTIFTNGTVLTVDDDFAEVDAIAIRGNRILAVGTEGEVRAVAGDGARVVDLEGKTMLPGFIDAHTHVVTGSVVDAIMDYVGMIRFRTSDEVLDHIRARVAETPAGEWLVFRNFDPAVQDGLDALTFADLDPISTDHPIFVLNASGHLAYANSAAFAAAGIPADIENPPGAEFVRDADGTLNGTMKNNISYLRVLGAYPALAEAQPLEALIALLEKWSALGLTTISELSLGALTQSPADAEVLAAASQSGRLAARIRAYPLFSIGAENWDDGGVSQGDGDAMARIAGYKLIADGSNQGFTGLQRDPYLNSEDRGLAYLEPDELTRLAMERAEKGWHLALHGNGDAAIDNILNTCEALRDAGIDMSRVRARIEHCSILHDDQIARMKELGVSASFLIGHVHYWGVALRDEVFGEEKVQLLDRCRSVEEAGVGFTLHSDFMVIDPDPLHMIEMAVTRTTWKEPDYVLAPQETIPVESAIRALTSEAAWQLFSDHEVGSLEAGKYADMVILDKDPRDVVPNEIRTIKVLETWMDGRQTFVA
ncbi:amidohydrolase [Phaeobacter sp. B1627]|uniref:amidohydrolase n=1 Tax=Phaeobacter sp. B1627 TaxID=2583809 RepID=UPI00111AA5B8|nr:amidohydrolase [Phaeobacter sp. B1627]TNJ40631.1 amidohydrolase [Phaeobacter sp. B1627]